MPAIDPCSGGRVCDDAGCWVTLCGGTYERGSAAGDPDERPVRRVHVAPLQVLEREATVGLWSACVAASGCREDPDWSVDALCTRSDADLPITCIDWFQARDLCAFAGGRLPSEAEWEFAARSGGRDLAYPWGDARPTCDRLVSDRKACGVRGLQPGCSRPAGNTSQGVCDLAGNAFEWCADWHHGYGDAPTDGSAQGRPGRFRSMRGGGIGSDEAPRTRNRVFHPPEFSYPGLGVRCVRGVAP
ncbi:MAG: SUMF1/EgtB/PvdO family nonheme iron enzyme [Deltaproteobacteria bacterium]|nr:SUMF1/EgtB/PvdO family nonheme iron enzyme [Deltaproteobacteria bacterium]